MDNRKAVWKAGESGKNTGRKTQSRGHGNGAEPPHRQAPVPPPQRERAAAPGQPTPPDTQRASAPQPPTAPAQRVPAVTKRFNPPPSPILNRSSPAPLNRGPVAPWLIPAIILFGAGFVVASTWDLQINQALNATNNINALIMEAFAWLPAFLPIILLFVLWATRRGSAVWRRVTGAVLGVIGAAGLSYAVFHYLEKRGLANGLSDYRTYIYLIAAVIVAILVILWISRFDDTIKNQLTFMAVAGTAYLILTQIAVQVIKVVWQRTRFDDMLQMGSFQDFTPWYEPFGNGGSSLPSAHTANAAGIFFLIILCDIFPTFNKHRRLCYLICWVYVTAMAISRIVIGRHFLSDTLVAAGIAAILFFILRSTKPYRIGLASAQDGLAPSIGKFSF